MKSQRAAIHVDQDHHQGVAEEDLVQDRNLKVILEGGHHLTVHLDLTRKHTLEGLAHVQRVTLGEDHHLVQALSLKNRL